MANPHLHFQSGTPSGPSPVAQDPEAHEALTTPTTVDDLGGFAVPVSRRHDLEGLQLIEGHAAGPSVLDPASFKRKADECVGDAQVLAATLGRLPRDRTTGVQASPQRANPDAEAAGVEVGVASSQLLLGSVPTLPSEGPVTVDGAEVSPRSGKPGPTESGEAKEWNETESAAVHEAEAISGKAKSLLDQMRLSDPGGVDEALANVQRPLNASEEVSIPSTPLAAAATAYVRAEALKDYMASDASDCSDKVYSREPESKGPGDVGSSSVELLPDGLRAVGGDSSPAERDGMDLPYEGPKADRLCDYEAVGSASSASYGPASDQVGNTGMMSPHENQAVDQRANASMTGPDGKTAPIFHIGDRPDAADLRDVDAVVLTGAQSSAQSGLSGTTHIGMAFVEAQEHRGAIGYTMASQGDGRYVLSVVTQDQVLSGRAPREWFQVAEGSVTFVTRDDEMGDEGVFSGPQAGQYK